MLAAIEPTHCGGEEMHRTLTLAVIIASVAVGGAAAAEKKPNGEHHYYWVTFPPAPANQCDPSNLAGVLHEANLCSAAEQTTVPDRANLSN
jgi:hypothetical protein